MGFFNELGKKTTETTTKIAREAKLKVKISENKSKIKDLYEEIGKKVYENHVREEYVDIKDFIKDDCLNIDNLSKEIEEARKEILVLNNKKLCTKCFAEIEVDDKFCSKCGERQTNEKTVLEKAEDKLKDEKITPDNKKESENILEELEQKNENDENE